MISHEHKCIFIHIPRTGGTALERSFNFADEPTKHLCAKSIYLKVGQKIWDNYFKFTFVRNPWDRVISLWHQPIYKKINALSGHSLEFFLDHYNPCSHEQGVTFKDYLNYGVIDFVGRFENRMEDLGFISEKINHPIDALARDRSTSPRKPYQHYYTASLEKRVQQKYKEDIETYNYTFV